MITASRLAKGVVRALLLLLVPLSVCQAAPTVSIVSVPSAAMNRNVTCSVMLPSAYATDSAAYPVVYMLHGSGNDNTTYSSAAEIQQLVETYGFIAVCPKDGTDWWLDAPGDPSIRYETFVASELVAYVDRNYRTVADRSRRMIAGHSMGGHGAGFIGMRHKDVFGTVGIVIGGVDLTQDTARADLVRLLGPYAVNETLWRNHSVVTEAAKLSDGDLNLYIAVGVDDMFIAPNRTLDAVLTEAGVTHTYEELTQSGYTTHTRATAYYGLGKAFAFAASAWGVAPSAGGSSGSPDATPENTYYLLGNDPENASSMTGAGSPVGWTNAFGTAATKVVAGRHYVVDGKYTPEGKIGSLRTPTAGGDFTFAGASLTLNNGSQIFLTQSSGIGTIPQLYVKEGEGLISLARDEECAGDWQVLSGGRLVFNRRTTKDSRTLSVLANLSGPGEVRVANAVLASGYITFSGDNSGLMGSFVLESERDENEIRLGASSWFGNPSEPGAAVVDLKSRKCKLVFKEAMDLATPNRVIDFGNCRSWFTSNPTVEGTRVTIDSPLRGTQGLVLACYAETEGASSVFVLTGDNSELSGNLSAQPSTKLVLSNALAAASAVPRLNGSETAPTVFEIDLDGVGESGAVLGGYPSGTYWTLSLRGSAETLEGSVAVMRVKGVKAADFVAPPTCLYNDEPVEVSWAAVQSGSDVILYTKGLPETVYYLTTDRQTINSGAQWTQRCAGPQTISTVGSDHDVAVDKNFIVKTPTTAGKFPGRALYLAGGALYPTAGSKKLYTIDNLYFFGSENNEIRVAADGGVVLGGSNWTLMGPSAVAWLGLGQSSSSRSMEIQANFHSAQGGTILCADTDSAVTATDLTLSGDNSDFAGRLVCDCKMDGSRIIIQTATAWPADPVKTMPDGLTLRRNATLSIPTTVTSGPTRGVKVVGGNAKIRISADNTLTLQGTIDAPQGFVKGGAGTLVLANADGTATALSDVPTAAGQSIRVTEGEMRVARDVLSAFDVSSGAALSASPDHDVKVGSVVFASGACLCAKVGQTACLAPQADCSFGTTGTIELSNPDAIAFVSADLIRLPPNATGVENLANWSVSVDGQVRKSLRPCVKDGKVSVSSRGLIIVVQ